MRPSRPRRAVAIVAVVALTGALAACGSDDAASSSDPASEASVTAAAATGTDESSTDAHSSIDANSSDVLWSTGRAMVVLGDETFEFAPTGDPFSCFVDTNSGVVMATFEGLTDAGDELYVDYDSDLGDPVAANLSTVDPVAAWFFGTGIAGTEVTQTDITSGDGTFSVSGEMTSSRPDVDPRAATVTLECS